MLHLIIYSFIFMCYIFVFNKNIIYTRIYVLKFLKLMYHRIRIVTNMIPAPVQHRFYYIISNSSIYCDKITQLMHYCVI
jgi:hypothetical protein